MFHGSKVVDGFGEEHVVLYTGGVQSGTTNLVLVPGVQGRRTVVLSALAMSTASRPVSVGGGPSPMNATPEVPPDISSYRQKKPIYVCDVGADLVLDSTSAGGATLWMAAYVQLDASGATE